MRALTASGFAFVLAGWCACAGAPPARIDSSAPPDTAATLWGDEYDEPVDVEERFFVPRALHAERVEGATTGSRLDATAEGVTVRLRSQPRGDTGTLGWRGTGVLREIRIGHVTPSASQGALVGTTGNGSDLRPPSSAQSEGLRMVPATSTRETTKGAGVVLQSGVLRASAAGCETREGARATLAGLERRGGSSAIGVLAGARMHRGPSQGAGSMYASREGDATFAGVEVAVSGGRVRSVAHIVAGERREWSAVAIAGAGPAREDPLVFDLRERRGAAVERRDAWMRGSSRVGVSSLTRRDDGSEVRRRRVSWDGVWRAGDGIQVALAARVTRDVSRRRADGYLAAPPSVGTGDEWRARATLRTTRRIGDGGCVENSYRLEWVQGRSGSPGTVMTWTGRIRSGPLDGRVSASAHALLPGQVAYEADAAPLAAGQFSAVSGRGATLGASVRLRLGQHAWMGLTWARRAPAPERIWVSAGLRI